MFGTDADNACADEIMLKRIIDKVMINNKRRKEMVMNKVILMGRLTRDPEVRYGQGPDTSTYARYTLAVDRRWQNDGNRPTADFIGCIAFGKAAEFAEKYLRQGMKIVVTGRIQTGSYTNREGQKVYTTDVVVEDQEFAESKSSSEARQSTPQPASGRSSGGEGAYAERRMPASVGADGFMNIPDGIDEELPFN